MATVKIRADKWLEMFNRLSDDDVTTYVNPIANISDVFGGYWNVSNQKAKEPEPPKPKKIPYPTWASFKDTKRFAWSSK